MRLIAFVSGLGLVTIAPPAVAQWRIGVELMNPYYRGTAVDTSGNPHARPGNALIATLHFDRAIGDVRVGWRLSYSKPGLSLTGEGVTITDRTNDQLLETAATAGFRVGGGGSSGAVRAELGPALHLWKVADEIRARVGGLLAGAYEWPVSTRFTGTVRIEGTLSKSWFDAIDLPPEYRRQITWRFGWGMGLRYRL